MSARYVALTLAAVLLVAGTATKAADDDKMEMASAQGGSAPPDARDPNAYSDGVDFTRGAGRPQMADTRSFGSFLFDNFEVTRVDGETVVPFDIEAWFGPTYDRGVLKSEGELENGSLAEARTELYWGHAFAPYFDSQIGVRYDSGPGPNRSWLAAGIEGLAPYRFDLSVTAYVGESSRTALRLDASYDMLITQRLIFRPRLEADFYGKSDPGRGLGSGLSQLTLSLRLRYEIRRELAPYVGLESVNERGGTESRTRTAGGDPNETRLVAGVRFWF